MDRMSHIAHYLNDPKNVAAFQHFFGVRRKVGKTKPEEHTNNYKADDVGDNPEAKLVMEEFEIIYRFWFYLFQFGTALGGEFFLSLMFPCWFWNIDGAVGRRMAVIWSLSMYIGQSLKDIICWPRPACPPVIRAQEKWALEYGMPSTHAVVSVTVPFGAFLLTSHRYDYPSHLGFLAACFFCILISSSRLYFGMHSLADIVAGIILGVVMLAVLVPFSDAIDSFLLTHSASPGILITTAVTLMLIYPGSKFSSAREDTAIIVGSSFGLMIGSWMCYQMGSIRGPPMEPPYAIMWPSLNMWGLCLLRTIIGLITIVVTRVVMKPVSTTIMKSLLQPNKDIKSNGDEGFVIIAAKLLCYAFMGIDIIFFAPALFRLLNIERLTFHTEI